MRIAIAAILGFILVTAMEFGAWLVSNLVLATTALLAAIPAGTGAFRVVPAVVGLVFLWRTFKLMERPAQPLTVFQAASAFAHHQKELRAAALASALLMTSVMLSQLAAAGQVPVPVWLYAADMAITVSVCFSVLILVLSGVRVRKSSWFLQEPNVTA